MSQVKYDTKSYKKTYNKKLAEQEEYCEACCIKVKLISMPKHRLGKKHIENEKKRSNDIIDEVFKTAELLKQENSKKNPKDIILELYYAIQAQYFNEDGDEIIPEEDFFTKPETKTKEEEAFCAQSISHMFVDLSGLLPEIEYIAPPSFLESIDAQINKVDAAAKTAKKDLLNIYRRIIKQKSIKEEPVEEPKIPIKTIEQPKMPIKTIEKPVEAPKPILKKKVEIVVEEEEQLEEFEFYNPFTYTKFLKLTPDHKIDYLESFFDNVSKEMIDDYYELYNDYEKSYTVEEYNLLYRRILYSIENIGKNEEHNSEEEEEDEFNYGL